MTQLPSSNVQLTTEIVARDRLVPNSWNPNRMTASMYAKALESIQTYGFIDPLLVREQHYDLFQIIDGEHRFRAGCDLGMSAFPVVNIGLIDDAKAKKLTIVMNELHGQADPVRMGDLLNEILSLTSLEELMVALPYEPDMLAGFVDLPELPVMAEKPVNTTESKEPWAERLFKMPKSVALIVDEAIEKAKDGEELESWQALERVAADYLAS